MTFEIKESVMILLFLLLVFFVTSNLVISHEQVHYLIDEDYGDLNISTKLVLMGFMGGETTSVHIIDNVTDSFYYLAHHNNDIITNNVYIMTFAIMLSVFWLGLFRILMN